MIGRHLATFNLFRESDGSLQVTIADAGGVKAELNGSGAPLHLCAMNALRAALSNAAPPLRNGLKQAEAALIVGVSTKTLQRWERSGFGPKPTHDGPMTLYDPEDVATFVQARRDVGAGMRKNSRLPAKKDRLAEEVRQAAEKLTPAGREVFERIGAKLRTSTEPGS